MWGLVHKKSALTGLQRMVNTKPQVLFSMVILPELALRSAKPSVSVRRWLAPSRCWKEACGRSGGSEGRWTAVHRP